MSIHDKFKARISSTIKCEVIGKNTLSKDGLKQKAEKMEQSIEKNNPRWTNEIPVIKDNGKKRKLTKKEKKKQKNLEMLSRMIKLMNGLTKINLKIWINDIEICLLLYRTQSAIRTEYNKKEPY